MVTFNKDGSLTLESAEEVAEFNGLRGLAASLRQKQIDRATRVLDAFLAGDEIVDMDDPTDMASTSVFDWQARMNDAIDECLDHRSITAFVELIVSRHVQASQAARAHQRHASSADARAFVRSDWVKHASAYENNKSAFARDYVRRVKNEFDVTVTEKTIREVWLVSAPAAGTPAG